MLYIISLQGQNFKASICLALSSQLIIHNELFFFFFFYCHQAQLSTGDKSLYCVAIFHFFMLLSFPFWHSLIGYTFTTEMNILCITGLSFLQIHALNNKISINKNPNVNCLLSTVQIKIVDTYCTINNSKAS